MATAHIRHGDGTLVREVEIDGEPDVYIETDEEVADPDLTAYWLLKERGCAISSRPSRH